MYKSKELIELEKMIKQKRGGEYVCPKQYAKTYRTALRKESFKRARMIVVFILRSTFFPKLKNRKSFH
jgi:hypothetical protein